MTHPARLAPVLSFLLTFILTARGISAAETCHVFRLTERSDLPSGNVPFDPTLGLAVRR